MSWRWFGYLVVVGVLALFVHASYALFMRLL